MSRNKILTQTFSTWGEKLLQHCNVLRDIQIEKTFRPITVQLAPTEACDSSCTFCSVGNRPSGIIKFEDVIHGLEQFRNLGAKSLEITGGGNPLLYRHGDKKINDIICYAGNLGYKIGIITNSEKPSNIINQIDSKCVQWIRVSLAKLDEGFVASDYDFYGFEGKVALSYIIHGNTTERTISQIAEIVQTNPHVRFVRIAPDCTTDDAKIINDKWQRLVDKYDPDGKWFIKDIGDNYLPFCHGCYIGMLRPYWTSTGIYICTSHVLKTKKYEPEWRLCGVDDITKAWFEMNLRFKNGMKPYDIDISKCWHCYYFNNNSLLHTISNRTEDWEFA